MHRGEGLYRTEMRRLTFLVVLVAFIFSSGGQWTALQCVAWANMVREYSEVVPFGQALEMTLSGKYPCAMCKAIAEKKQSENNKAAGLFKDEKKIFSPAFALSARSMTINPQVFFLREKAFQTWCETPPVPPPRFV